MSSGFEIPPEQVPEDPRALSAMINFLNDVNTGFNFSGTEQLWEERGFPPDILGDFISFALSTADFTRDNGMTAALDLTELYKHWEYTFLEENPNLTNEMVDAFNSSFWGDKPERLVAIHSLARNTLTILGGVPPISAEGLRQ